MAGEYGWGRAYVDTQLTVDQVQLYVFLADQNAERRAKHISYGIAELLVQVLAAKR